LQIWAQRKLGLSKKEAKSVGYLIARKISKEGTPAKPFAKPAEEKLFPAFAEKIKQIVRTNVSK
jgi:hypothetical protein